jgi:hypothetical protein
MVTIYLGLGRLSVTAAYDAYYCSSKVEKMMCRHKIGLFNVYDRSATSPLNEALSPISDI